MRTCLSLCDLEKTSKNSLCSFKRLRYLQHLSVVMIHTKPVTATRLLNKTVLYKIVYTFRSWGCQMAQTEVSNPGVEMTEFCWKVDFVPLRNVLVPLGADGTNVLETNCK